MPVVVVSSWEPSPSSPCLSPHPCPPSRRHIPLTQALRQRSQSPCTSVLIPHRCSGPPCPSPSHAPPALFSTRRVAGSHERSTCRKLVENAAADWAGWKWEAFLLEEKGAQGTQARSCSDNNQQTREVLGATILPGFPAPWNLKRTFFFKLNPILPTEKLLQPTPTSRARCCDIFHK